jgi:hypothetical protein
VKRVVVMSLTAEVKPLAPGEGMPTGAVTFLVKMKRLGTASLIGGEATLSFKPGKVLNKSITITYAGADAFTSAGLAVPRLTSRSLAHVTAPSDQIVLSRPTAQKTAANARPAGPGR